MRSQRLPFKSRQAWFPRWADRSVAAMSALVFSLELKPAIRRQQSQTWSAPGCVGIPSGRIMFRMPWISLVLVALVCVSPLGQEVYRGLQSGEQLARSMSHGIVFIYGPILFLSVLAELGIRVWINARRRKAAHSTES
jgi:hypothetical protein